MATHKTKIEFTAYGFYFTGELVTTETSFSFDLWEAVDVACDGQSFETMQDVRSYAGFYFSEKDVAKEAANAGGLSVATLANLAFKPAN